MSININILNVLYGFVNAELVIISALYSTVLTNIANK
jgi:hypothetical protein